jgi:hypothetical protein
MKRIILALAVIAAFNNRIQAQENKTDLRSRCMIGLKGGLNYSNVYDSDGENFQTDPKAGMAAGLFLAIPLGTYLGIQPELLLSQRGFRATGSILGGTYDLSRSSNYLDIPVLFALKPSEFFTLLAGPQFSYLYKQTDVFTNATTSIEQQTAFKNDNFRKNTVCVTGGLDITMKHIVLSGRMGWDVLSSKGDGTSSTPRYKNVWYQATIGYRFY